MRVPVEIVAGIRRAVGPDFVVLYRLSVLDLGEGGQSWDEVVTLDNVVVCAGQEPNRCLVEPLRAAGLLVHVIGGADVAAELDAKRAIDQGTRLAARL